VTDHSWFPFSTSTAFCRLYGHSAIERCCAWRSDTPFGRATTVSRPTDRMVRESRERLCILRNERMRFATKDRGAYAYGLAPYSNHNRGDGDAEQCVRHRRLKVFVGVNGTCAFQRSTMAYGAWPVVIQRAVKPPPSGRGHKAQNDSVCRERCPQYNAPTGQRADRQASPQHTVTA
jgi:hypothetical protein